MVGTMPSSQSREDIGSKGLGGKLMELFHSPSAKHEFASLGSGSKSNAIFSAAGTRPNHVLNDVQERRNNVPVRE